MLRFARVLPIALIAFAGACADAPEPAAPSSDAEQVRFHLDDGSMFLLPDLSEVALYQPGEAPHGPANAQAFIGPEGGSLRLGEFEIVVPPGAVSSKRLFQIHIWPAAAQRHHAWVWFAPHNQQFNKPVTIRLPHRSTTSAQDPKTPIVWWSGRDWEPLVTQPTRDGRIEARTSHFSLYATYRTRGFTTVGG